MDSVGTYQKLTLAEAVSSASIYEDEGQPNFEFGGSQAEGTALLRQMDWYVPLENYVAADQACKDFVNAVSKRSSRLDQAFAALPRSSYCAIPPNTAAWSELCRRMSVNESNLWSFTALSCLPPRKQGGIDPPKFAIPQHATERSDFAAAVLAARGDINAYHPHGTLHHEGTLDIPDTDKQEMRRLASGFDVAKRGFAVLSSIEMLQHAKLLPAHFRVREAGLHAHKLACRNSALASASGAATSERKLLLGVTPHAIIVNEEGAFDAVLIVWCKAPFGRDGERSGAGEAQSGWEYKPFSSVQCIPDPSLLLQLQMSMCVTGASHGYVVSWSRTNMRIWHATYAPDVVAAVDQSVQTVGELYAHSQEQVPTSVSGFPDSLRDALKLLVSRIEHFCSSSSSSVRSVEVPEAMHRVPALPHPMWFSSSVEAMPIPLQDGQIRSNERGLTEGQAGAKLRTAIENQAKPRVACGLVCNRLHDKAKGTTANELTHRSFDRYTRSCGGTRRYDVLHALVAFQVYQQNEKKLVDLGLKEADESIGLHWPDAINLEAMVSAAQPLQEEGAQDAPWILKPGEVCDASWLDEHDFHVKRRVQRTWTDQDVKQLEEGLMRLQRGQDLPPSEFTDPMYYISHHVMEKKFSAQACARQIMSMYSRGRDAQAVQMPQEWVAGVAEQAADLGVEGDESQFDSEDEAIL